jgi:hypothetical protein
MGSLTSVMKTRAPSAAKVSAMALPMPDPPPVMRTRLLIA